MESDRRTRAALSDGPAHSGCGGGRGCDDGVLGQASHDALPNFKPWKLWHSLRSHLDVVRSVAFTSSERWLVSASDDGTVKLWNVQAPLAKSKCVRPLAPSADVRPHALM